nr:flagellin [Paracoccus saliphilus]
MSVNSIGDQARAFALHVASNRLKTTLTTLTKEVSSGEVADLGMRLQGNTRALNEIEGRLGTTRQLQRNGAEAANQLQGVQDLFDAVRVTIGGLGIALASDPFAGAGVDLGTRATEVAQTFDAVIQRLNGTNSNRFLLSGQASDVAPLSGGAEILDALQVATTGLTSASDVAQAISDWFDAPQGSGGFVDVAYHGTLGAGQRIPVGEGIAVEITTTAAAPAVRDLLKGLATAAILDRGVLAGNPVESRQLTVQAGRRLIDADTALLGEMGRIGLGQQVIDRAQSANAAALDTLERSRNDIRRADPFETAAALTEVQTQLESLYAVTARLSKLKLVDYLR